MKRLIEYASCGGCAGKIPVQTVARIVAGLPRATDPNLLVGAEHFSDASVYRLTDDLAIVNTIDFFPPMVDDPFTFGQIAAANALSDVYAMGAVPKTCLNVVAFPDNDADPDVLRRILLGASDRVALAEASIVGGHSLRDNEIKFGLAVTGVVNPAKMMTNAGAKAGDVLVLTKALGTGFAATAFRSNQCPDDVLAAACASMIQLNRAASEAAVALGAHGATDITGFGLAGHANEMAQASGVTVALHLRKLPQLPGTLDLVKAGHMSRATKSNRDFVAPVMSEEGGGDPLLSEYLFDAQTSGGLLISIAPERAEELLARCRANDLPAATIIGEVRPRGDAALIIVS